MFKLKFTYTFEANFSLAFFFPNIRNYNKLQWGSLECFFFCIRCLEFLYKIYVTGGVQQYLYLRIVQMRITIYNFKIWELKV